MFEEISKEQYDKFRLKLEKEKREIESISEKSGVKSSNLQKAIEKAIDYALNLPLLWQSGDVETKRKLQYMLFPEGIEYDFQNDRFRTFRINTIFSVIATLSNGLSLNKNGIHQNPIDESLLVQEERFELSGA